MRPDPGRSEVSKAGTHFTCQGLVGSIDWFGVEISVGIRVMSSYATCN